MRGRICLALLGGVEHRGELGGREVVDLEEPARAHAAAHDASTCVRIATAAAISSSVTSSDGANRSAVGVTAFTTRPASRQALATGPASMPVVELGRDQQTDAADVGDAGHVEQRLGEHVAGAGGARGRVDLLPSPRAR